MTSTVSYEGYVAQLTMDLDANVIHGEVVNTRDVLTFSVRELREVKQAFADTIEDYKEWCASEGRSPQKPLSGTMTLRMSPELHQSAANCAAIMKLSLNAWIVQSLECTMGNRPATLTASELDGRVAAGVREEVVRVLSARTTIGGNDEMTPWSQVDQDSGKIYIQ